MTQDTTKATENAQPKSLDEFLTITLELGINPEVMVEALCADPEAMRIIASEKADK